MVAHTQTLKALLEKQRILVIDGGLATELERRGADLRGKLWSARMLIDDPALIRQVHFDFMAAGADIVISASYQASISGFADAGMSKSQAAKLIQLSVELACEARHAFCTTPRAQHRLKPLVAASIGPYGACLADGSEYHGNYGLTKEELIDFHRPRMETLDHTDADIFAFETIPSLMEAEALLELLGEFSGRTAWLSLSCRDSEHVSHGERFKHCVALADNHPQIEAIGVNCTNPEFVADLLASVGPHEKPLLAYPNSGENWNSAQHEWEGQGSQLDPGEWARAGARLIGGCCRVGLEQISQLRSTLVRESA